MKRTGSSKSRTYEAVSLLKKLGYITQKDNRHMAFYAWPHLEVVIPETFVEFLNLKNEDKINVYKALKDKEDKNAEEEQMCLLCLGTNLVE